MEPTADPGALDAAARLLRQQADLLDQGSSLTGTFARQAAGSRWSGRAATQFRNAVNDDWNKNSGLAGDLRAIAKMIEDGATKIRKYRAEQAKLAQQQAQAKNAPSKPLAAFPP